MYISSFVSYLICVCSVRPAFARIALPRCKLQLNAKRKPCTSSQRQQQQEQLERQRGAEARQQLSHKSKVSFTKETSPQFNCGQPFHNSDSLWLSPRLLLPSSSPAWSCSLPAQCSPLPPPTPVPVICSGCSSVDAHPHQPELSRASWHAIPTQTLACSLFLSPGPLFWPNWACLEWADVLLIAGSSFLPLSPFVPSSHSLAFPAYRFACAL